MVLHGRILVLVFVAMMLGCESFLVLQSRNKASKRIKPPRVSTSENHMPDPETIVQPGRPNTIRSVRNVEQFARLPIWPAWNGVLLFLVSRMFGHQAAARLENKITGRVCPNFYNYQDTSPFIMLVHHCHSFHKLDPLRYVQRSFFPEGFPAHPHRGFITITYILHGGFVHRDSQGVQQIYGAEQSHGGKHTQWLMTGSGMLHEEMFETKYERQELYQIWLNVPSRHKFDTPSTLLMGGGDEMPTVQEDQSRTIVLAGSYRDKKAAAPTLTDLALFHVTLPPNGRWHFDCRYQTAFLYVRQGILQSGETTIPAHHTAYFASNGAIELTSIHGADFLFLAGEPIREPIVASGSMVMNSNVEIQQAYADYNNGLFGIPWDHKLSNQQWKEHIKNTTGNGLW